MTTMDFLEFYPNEVEKFSDYCDKALEDAGFDDIEIEEYLFSPLQDAVDQIMHGVSQIPRDMRPADFFLELLGNYTVEALQERFPDEEISFERNRLDCHLVINGEDYSPKYDNIKSMFEYYYADSALALKGGDELALTTATIERGEVKIAVDLTEEVLATLVINTRDEDGSYSEIEELVFKDGAFTLAFESADFDGRRYNERTLDKQEALKWVRETSEFAKQNLAASYTDGFYTEDALFGHFPELPELIDEFGAKLAINVCRQSEVNVVETLSRKQGKYSKYTVTSKDESIGFKTSSLELSEEESLEWLNNAKVDKGSTLKLTKAGEVLFPDLVAYDPLALTGDLDITFDRCAATDDGRVVIVGSMCFDNLREALLRGEKCGEISERDVDDILDSEYIVEMCVYRTENNATMRINAFSGNGEAKCGCNVPLTRDEQAQLIKLTQEMYEAVDKKTADKPKKSFGKEIGD